MENKYIHVCYFWITKLLLLLLLRGGFAQGLPYIATISNLLCVPVWVLIIPDSSIRDLWQLPAETSTSEGGETW
jgi:hypothetical protein